MKVLVIYESPLTKIGQDYYAVDSWMRFALFLAARCEQVTLWTPVVVREPGTSPSPDRWRLDLGALRIEHQDHYNTFVSYYKLWLRRGRSWQQHADHLVREHDVVVLWHPSPMIGMVARSANQFKKPFVVVLAGDLRAQSDRILASRGLRKFLYRLLIRFWVRREIRCCRCASLLYAYSRELAMRHSSSTAEVKLMRSFSHISLADFVHREDSCQGTDVRLLRACWLIPSKGLEYLLKAVAVLVRRGVNVRLEVIGKERTAGYQGRLENLARRLGIGDRVHFPGWMPFDRIHEAYLRSDIQVISSLAEGTPRVIFEGAARGLPLVCTTAGGSADTLRHETDALLVPPADPTAMADAIQRIVENGPLRRRLIENGYALAREASFEHVGLEFLEDLRKLTTSPSHRG